MSLVLAPEMDTLRAEKRAAEAIAAGADPATLHVAITAGAGVSKQARSQRRSSLPLKQSSIAASMDSSVISRLGEGLGGAGAVVPGPVPESAQLIASGFSSAGSDSEGSLDGRHSLSGADARSDRRRQRLRDRSASPSQVVSEYAGAVGVPTPAGGASASLVAPPTDESSLME